MVWIRHGDVVLEKVDNIKGRKMKKKEEIILAEGEVTGHFHRLKGQLCEYVHEKERYVEVLEDAELCHEEHDTLQIPKGSYKVLIQREVDLLGQIRQVMD